MRNPCGMLALMVIGAVTVLGCGESSTKTETVPFKQTDASQFQDMLPKKPSDRTKKPAAPAAAPSPAQ